MVLQPIGPKPCPTVHYNARPNALPVWTVIAKRQKQCASSWLLVAQPDHAKVSGDLAANFVSQQFPKITPEIAKAIELHDSGWGDFLSERDMQAAPLIGDDWKPRSFIEFPPKDFLNAWNGSIERTSTICATGGLIVSRHFCELAQMRLKENVDDEADAQLVREFLSREQIRQEALGERANLRDEESDGLLRVLQLCDLLSLYLCSGATDDAEFPQRFGGKTIQITKRQDVFVLNPSPFQSTNEPHTVEVIVPARVYPAQGKTRVEKITYKLQ